MDDKIIGTRIGLWKVVSFDESTIQPKKRRRYYCVCDCGTERSVLYHDLVNKKRPSQSCGCRGRKMHKVSEGDQFTRWTVIEEAEKRDGKRVMKCKCSCGWIGFVRLQDLVGGISRSCGCLRSEEQSASRKGKLPFRYRFRELSKGDSQMICYPDWNDLSGQKFHRWTVIKRVQNNHSNKVTYLCRCDCGETGNVSARDLKVGNSKSCGCLRLEHLARLNASGGNIRKSSRKD